MHATTSVAFFSLGLATQDGLLSQLATVALNDLPDDYLETYREKVRALTPPDLLATARKYFDSANMQIVVVGDRTQIEPQQLYSAILTSTTPTANISANYQCYLLIRSYLLASWCYARPQTNSALNLWPPDALLRRGRHLGRNKKAAAQANQHQHRKLRGAPASPRNRPRNRRKILQMRKSYGVFKSVDDLLSIRGIGKKRLEKMRNISSSASRLQ